MSAHPRLWPLLAAFACGLPANSGEPVETTTESTGSSAADLTEAQLEGSTAGTTDRVTTGDVEPGPCDACGPDEYCRWRGADDLCDGTAPVTCEPLPAGCTRETLCTLECVHHICGGYSCSGVNPCELAGAVACDDRCDPHAAVACLVDGTHCTAISADDDPYYDDFACVPEPADGHDVGEACSVTAADAWRWGDCKPGLLCHEVDPDGAGGTCKARCTGALGELACDDPDAACIEWTSGQDLTLHLCEPTCDPLDPSACEPDETCIHVEDQATAANTFACIVDVSGGAGASFDACQSANQCDPGLTCVAASFVAECEAASDACCVPFCDLDQPACPPTLTCQPFHGPGEAPAGQEHIGLCLT